jgi:hypothetical protein
MSRPRLQFRLRTLLAVLAVFLVWLGYHAERSHRQKRAVAAIEALGGHVSYQGDLDAASGLTGWLERLFGKDSVRNVSAVFLAGRPIDDANLDPLADLPWLETVNLASTPLTDAGLERLNKLKRLKHIDIRFSQVSDEGVKRLRAALPNAKIYRVSDIE